MKTVSSCNKGRRTDTYSVPFLVEHERSNGTAGVSMIAGLATNPDGGMSNAELILGAGDSMGRGRHCW